MPVPTSSPHLSLPPRHTCPYLLATPVLISSPHLSLPPHHTCPCLRVTSVFCSLLHLSSPDTLLPAGSTVRPHSFFTCCFQSRHNSQRQTPLPAAFIGLDAMFSAVTSPDTFLTALVRPDILFQDTFLLAVISPYSFQQSLSSSKVISFSPGSHQTG
jgi:hypothetical protein